MRESCFIARQTSYVEPIQTFLHSSLFPLGPVGLVGLSAALKKTRNICYEQSQAQARHTLPSLEPHFQGLVKVTKPAQSEFMTRSTLN